MVQQNPHYAAEDNTYTQTHTYTHARAHKHIHTYTGAKTARVAHTSSKTHSFPVKSGR